MIYTEHGVFSLSNILKLIFIGLELLGAFCVLTAKDKIFLERSATGNSLPAEFEERSQGCEEKDN